jgi:N-acyl-D-aspartate/D-glutamate deacylase
LSLAEFIRASSGLPADILGLGDRGYLATGMIADVLVLDPKRYQENASFAEVGSFVERCRALDGKRRVRNFSICCDGREGWCPLTPK